jgi:hypothetical protein
LPVKTAKGEAAPSNSNLTISVEPSVPVDFANLLAAFEWVSATADSENAAYICRTTGVAYFTSSSMDLDDELPEDIEDDGLYIAVPHKVDLNLGKNLAIKFTAEHLPDDYSDVCGFFRQRGAYGRFKDLLERRDSLDTWYRYEAQAIEQALREWSCENLITLAAY